MKRPANAPLPAPVRALLRRFRGQRPLRAGSLLITLFGDAIAPRGGAVTLASLIRLAAPFGLTERLVRTSVARLARQGWLATRRAGRRSEYRLTPGGARRFAQATARIYGESPRDWDGSWTLLLLRPEGRQRPRLREELRLLGFGQLGAALFAHPSSTPEQARAWLRGVRGAGAPLLLRARSGTRAHDRQLTSRGWDLGELARRYRRFLASFAPVARALPRGTLTPATAFLVRTLLIHEYRKIHLRDPLLPPALLPRGWVGAAAYELCRRLYGEVFAAAETHLSGCAQRLQRPLPPAAGAVHGRFGGLEPARARQSLSSTPMRLTDMTPLV
jgi:phenylacetic acid degradation operon negative regulatory protein